MQVPKDELRSHQHDVHMPIAEGCLPDTEVVRSMDLEGEEASSSLVAPSCSSPDVSAVSDAALFYPVYDDFESDTRKQAAADALSHFSQFAMVCISKGVEPSRLKLHLMKEVSGMPTSLDGEQFSTKSQTAQDVASSSSAAASVSVDDMQLTRSDDRMQS